MGHLLNLTVVIPSDFFTVIVSVYFRDIGPGVIVAREVGLLMRELSVTWGWRGVCRRVHPAPYIAD